MAGTPTTNYNIPTYADTDAPDLSGAYNDAMGIIDTQLKANADAIESASTGNYTGTNPIVVDNEQRTISVSKARSAQVSQGSVTNYGDKGTLSFAGSADIITAVAGMPGDDKDTVVPNCYAVTQYVAAHGGTAYTAGRGINISGTTISNKQATGVSAANIDEVETSGITDDFLGGVRATANNPDVVDRLAAIDDAEHGYTGAAVPTVKALKGYVEQKMAAAGAAYTGTAPVVVDNGSKTISVSDATASAKGVVQLSTGNSVTSSTAVLTETAMINELKTIRNNMATQAVDVQTLAGKLFIDTDTGLVFYKPSV